jgi:hypothetical protein
MHILMLEVVVLVQSEKASRVHKHLEVLAVLVYHTLLLLLQQVQGLEVFMQAEVEAVLTLVVVVLVVLAAVVQQVQVRQTQAVGAVLQVAEATQIHFQVVQEL